MRHREHVFLSFAPALFDVLQSDVGGHASGHGADAVGDLSGIPQILARQAERFQQPVQVNPRGRAVVIGQARFHFFGRQRQAFHQPRASVHAGQAAAAIFKLASDDFEAERRVLFDVPAEQTRIHIRAERVDVVHHQVL